MFLVGVCETQVPVQPLPHALDLRRRRSCPPRCAATPPTCRSCTASTRSRSTPTAPTPVPTTPRRSCGSGTSRSPAPRTASGSRRTSGARAPRRSARRVFQDAVREQLEEWGEPVEHWQAKPVKGDPNPYAAVDPSRPWPETGTGREAALRIAAAARVREADPTAPDDGLDMIESARVADWDAELERLLAEATATAAPTWPCRCRAACRRPRWPASRGPGRVRPRPGPADAATTVGVGPVRHPLPRLGRGEVRPAGALRPRRAARPRGRRHRGRGRPGGADRDLRGGPVRRPVCHTPSRRRSRSCWAGRSCEAGSTRSTPRRRR